MRTTTSATPGCLRPFFRLLSALLVLGATASCSSSQSAFRFRPASSERVPASVAVVSAEPEAAVLPSETPVAAQAPKPPTRATATARPRLRRLAQPVAAWAHVPAASAAQAAPKARAAAAKARVRRAFAPQRPAEVGLGTTVLGVLGLIVLPLSLLGLLIWGGPVWLVLAGLSALAVLIAYLDPF
ncbi:hypothetical protein [Hymenobacter yonginensis]|uniref:Uncharacterized protein n=1 Tax=Hymenobacter yonginensis TaxID=748197 RepID=A0ABY7PMW7_9BACT|nr:hypothetical protein [Hymenobacter yonginensis]WBO84089.1 hypothetical protein O9Z63_17135 [Hymenobacter yonginensis]